MINFMIGRAGRKQSESIYTSLRSLPDSEKAFLIVPDQFTYETEKKVLSEKRADLNTEVISLRRLAYRLQGSFSEENVSVISGEAEAMLIKRAVELCRDEMNVFGDVSRTQGFCSEAASFIDEMKKSGINAENIKPDPENPPGINAKLEDIRKIYEKYTSLIPPGYIPADEFFAYISQKCEDSRIIKGAHFYFDGFYSFDKSEYPLISLIMRNAKSVTFSFITGTEKFFDVPHSTLSELYRITEEYGLEYTVTENTDTSLLTEEVKFLEEHLTGYENAVYSEDTDKITLISAGDMEEECDYIACEINRLIRDCGLRYSDFQIICTDKAYFPRLKRVFRRHNLEFFIDESRDISSTSAVRAFLYITDMLENSYTTTELISFAKSGFSPLCEEEYMLLENYVLETGVKGKMWESGFTKNNPEQSYDMDHINDMRSRLIRPVKNIRDNISGYTDVSDFVSRLVNSLEEIMFEERINEYIRQFVSCGDYENANIYSQINNRILSILSDLDRYFGEEYLSAKEIYDLLSFCLSAGKVGIIPSGVDEISIGDVIRSANRHSKVMFIAGCAEGLMPSANHNLPVLSDSERSLMKGIRLRSCSEYLRKRENFVYYTFMCSAPERLYLSYSTEGGENYPSVMFERIREIFPYCSCPDVASELLGEHMVDTRQYAFYKLTDMISSGFEGLDDTSMARAGGIMDSLDEGMTKEYMGIIRDGYSFGNESGINDKKAYHSIMNMPLVTSVSMLESYGRCPFLFFMNYVIKPTPRRLKRVKNTDLGNILHKVVEEFSRMIISGQIIPQDLSGEDIDGIATSVADRVLESYKDGLVSDVRHSKYLYRKLITSCVGAIKELVSQINLSEFIIGESEAVFGAEGKFDAVRLDISEDEKAYVRGIIDRIDYAGILGGKYLRIIDYKSSAKAFDMTALAGNISFQLPAYALAVKENDIDIAGVYYFRLSSAPVAIKKQMSSEEIAEEVKNQRKLNGLTLKDMDVVMAMDMNAAGDSFIANVKVKKDNTFHAKDGLFTKEEFDRLLFVAQKNMSSVCRDICDGKIPIRPYRRGQNENACTYCEYAEVCKFNSSFEKNSYRLIDNNSDDIFPPEVTNGQLD